MSHFAFHSDGAALLFYDGAADVEAQACAYGFFAYLVEAVKEMLGILF